MSRGKKRSGNDIQPNLKNSKTRKSSQGSQDKGVSVSNVRSMENMNEGNSDKEKSRKPPTMDEIWAAYQEQKKLIEELSKKNKEQQFIISGLQKRLARQVPNNEKANSPSSLEHTPSINIENTEKYDKDYPQLCARASNKTKPRTPKTTSIPHPPSKLNENSQDAMDTENSVPIDSEEQSSKVAAPAETSGLHIKPARNRNIPPITIIGGSSQSTIEIIKNDLNVKLSGEFYTSKTKGNKHTLSVQNLKDFGAVTEILQQKGQQFFTYTPQETKPHIVLLKNLEGDFDEETIREELNNYNIGGLNFLKVRNYSTRNSRARKKKLPIYLVHLSPDSKIVNLKKISRLLHQAIVWDKYNKTEDVQCYRCQRIGHVSKNCNLTPRCVKCLEDHPMGECSIDNRNLSVNDPTRKEIFCVICKGSGHPASYRGCPKVKEMKQKLQQNIEKNKELKQNKVLRIYEKVNPARAFSSLLKANGVEAAQPPQEQPEASRPQSQVQQLDIQEILEGWRSSFMKNINEQFNKVFAAIAMNSHRIDSIADSFGAINNG